MNNNMSKSEINYSIEKVLIINSLIITTIIIYLLIFISTILPLFAIIIDNRLNYDRWI